MVKGFSDAIARFFFGNIPTLFLELFDDLGHGVGGAGEIAAELGLEHG